MASKGLVFIPQGINVIRALTSNDIEVLKFLTKNLTKDFTILKIAKGVGKTNRLVYAAVKRLIKEKIIIVEEKAKLKLCRLNFEMPHIIALIESIRWHDFVQSHRDVDFLISDIIARSALLFLPWWSSAPMLRAQRSRDQI